MKRLNNMELIVEMGMVDNKKRNNNIVNTTKSKKRSVDSNKRNDIVEMSNNKSKKRSIGSNKRNKNKKFTLEYYVEKCVEVAATKGFKIKGEKMWAIGMFEINEAKYLLTVDKYGLLFWFVDLATLVIAVTRYLSKSQDDNYDLNRHYIPICDVWLMLLRCY